MRFYKHVKSGYIESFGKGESFTEISEQEYNEISKKIKEMPKTDDKHALKLKENMEWELIRIPVTEPEASTEDYSEQLDRYGVDYT